MTESRSRTETDSIRVRLLKVLRLAQDGVGGEKENAESLLAKLLRKHGMTLADLEGDPDQQRSRVWLSAGDGEERVILVQLVLRLFGTERKLWRKAGVFDAGVDVSPAEHAALAIAWDVYRAAFAEAREGLVMGFCFKHGLYAPDGGAPDMSDEGRARAERALSMAGILPAVESPGRRLSSGGDGGEKKS